MNSLNVNQKIENRSVADPHKELVIIPTRSGVGAVEVGSNAAQLQPHERLLADAGRGLTLFGGSLFTFNLLVAIGATYPLLLAFLMIAFPLAGHALRKRLTPQLRLVLVLTLLASLGTCIYSQVNAAYLEKEQANVRSQI
jgi:hypothetical protein